MEWMCLFFFRTWIFRIRFGFSGLGLVFLDLFLSVFRNNGSTGFSGFFVLVFQDLDTNDFRTWFVSFSGIGTMSSNRILREKKEVD
jgi:hypothetical protein